MRGVGIEVLFRQAHLRQVFAGGAGRHDRVGRRQVVGGDVVAQHRQRTHAGHRARLGQRAFPVGRSADVGAHLAPFVERRCLVVETNLAQEHRVVDVAELLRLHRRFHDGVNLGVIRPNILQRDRLAVGIVAQRILLDVEADGAGNGVGHHQRR